MRAPCGRPIPFFFLAATLACRPEPSVTPEPVTPAADREPDVPDDAYAIAGGVTIPRLVFDEALSKLSAGGPASRDDRGLRQRIGLALVVRELVRLELARLGATDVEALQLRASPLTAELIRERGTAVPTWWSVPPLDADDAAGAVVVAAEYVATAPDAEIAAAYEQQQDRWTSDTPWLRLDVWSLRYDDAVGIAECDRYIAKYRRCVAKFPTSTQPTVLADLGRQAAQWRAGADDAEHRELIATECDATETEAMQQTASMGCDWNTEADGAERKARAARRAELRASAQSARTRMASNEDLLAIVAAEGGAVAAGQMLASDELAKPVLAAIKGLGVGKVSKLIDDGHAWTVVRVLERHKAGTLPREVVASDVADDLRIRRLAEALEALPATLRGKYEVRLHASVESLDAGP